MLPVRNRYRCCIALLAALGFQAGCSHEPPKARFVHEVDWIGKGQWLKADLHAHTKFSDGSSSVAEVVDKAASFGCQVVAITDHGDRNLTAATQPYFEAIAEARKRIRK